MKLRTIYQYLFQRRLPFGLFSWRFLLPNQPTAIRFHRQLAMQGFPRLPRIVFLPIMLFSGLRWALIYSPYYTLLTVRRQCKKTQQKTGLTCWQQYWQVLSISMGHGLPPKNWYQYQMHQAGSKDKIWSYIYDQELKAFHAYRNYKRPKYQEHTILLGDKWHFEQLLLKHGITSTETLALIPKSSDDFLKQLNTLTAEHCRVFCKRRTGNQGHGAFSAFFKESQLCIQPRGQPPLTSQEAIIFLQKKQ